MRRHAAVVTFALCVAPLVVGWGSGCAGLRGSGGAEPGVLAVRNSSGRDVDRFSLAPVGPRDGSARHGSLSPVPRGVTQVVVRPTNAPRLSGEIDVEWTEVAGRSFSLRRDLRPVLAGARGGPQEALVFELLPDGGLRVDLERRMRPW
jgi:hypothetical protein